MRKCAWAVIGLMGAMPLAATTIYAGDQAGFLSALGPAFYLEDFEGLAPGEQATTSLDFSGAGITYTAQSVGVTPGNLFVFDEYSQTLSTASNEDDLLIAFTSGNVWGVGGNFFASLPDGTFSSTTVTLSLSDGTNTVYAPPNPTGFVGFIATPGVFFPSLNVAAPDFCSTPLHPNIDNLYAAGLTHAPEPATFALIGLGLIAIGWRARGQSGRRS